MWHDCGPRVLGIYFEPVRAEKIKQIAMSKDKETKKSEQEEVKEQPADAAGNGPQEATEGAGVKMAEEEAEKDSAAVKMAEEAAQWRDKYVRLSAEFDNYRKRTLKEKMDLISSAGERALDATQKASDVEAVREGVVLISNKLRDTLRTKGLSEIEAFGQELDTDFHEAVAKIPAPDKKQKGKIVDVVQKGYKLHDKVIRHSKVVVGE